MVRRPWLQVTHEYKLGHIQFALNECNRFIALQQRGKLHMGGDGRTYRDRENAPREYARHRRECPSPGGHDWGIRAPPPFRFIHWNANLLGCYAQRRLTKGPVAAHRAGIGYALTNPISRRTHPSDACPKTNTFLALEQH